MIYREACKQRLPWDAVLPEKLEIWWEKFKKSLPDEVRISCTLATFKEPVKGIDLHVFGETRNQKCGQHLCKLSQVLGNRSRSKAIQGSIFSGCGARGQPTSRPAETWILADHLITSWVARFIHNCKSRKANHLSGPLTTGETNKQVKGWVMRV